MPDDVSISSRRLAERYRVLFPVGKGGMGTVEVALERGTGTFRRIVALKHMLAEVSRERRNVDMFLREAALACRLNHPNVVHAFDAGDLDGELYISMEYVEGEPLSHVLKLAKERGGLGAELSAHVVAEICDGLHAAHELTDESGKLLNVVHRDLSPHNVMVAYEGHVKVLDFGVAKVDDTLKVTRTGEVKGKTAYMAPEQALGDSLDRRSDLFAVGAVLYECLTGERMWGQATDIQLMRRLALEDPPRLEATLPSAPAALVDLYTRLVKRQPDDRPATARDVSRELRTYISTSSAPGSADDRAMRALMIDLFGAEAAEKRKLLEGALALVVDQTRARELKLSLSQSTARLTDSERNMLAALKPPENGPIVHTQGTSDTFAAVDPLTSTVMAPALRTSRRLAWSLLLGIVVIGIAGAAIASLTRHPQATNGQMGLDAATSGTAPPSASTIATGPKAEPTVASVDAAAPDKSASATPTHPPGLVTSVNRANPATPKPRPSSGANSRPEIDTHAL